MTKLIKLGGKRAAGKSAMVDAKFYDVLSRHNWWCNSDGYAIRIEYEKGRYKRQIYMHKEILQVPPGMQVDHINRDVLDNRECNLREATPSQNQLNRTLLSNNTSGYKGVSQENRASKWRASIKKDGVQMNLGTYPTKEEAAKAYNVKAVELFGDYARLNEVDHTGFALALNEKSSRYRGVSYVKRVRKWQVTVKNVYLGKFDNEHDAARMYNFWALDMFGESANLNVITD